ncbi:MAG TPA: ABC transporter permease [Gemmatimonadaceae bacterium]|nr:ABC transporter permease [Gemmatimonadaceae bacterium]
MKLRRTITLSLRTLFSHRLRTTLALASVSVGAAAVVLSGAVGTGVERDVQRSIDRLGVNLLVVRPVAVKRSASRREFSGAVTTLRFEDYLAIAALPLVANAAPDVEGTARVKAGAFSTVTTIRGTTPAYLAIRRFELRSGRFIDDDDTRGADRVAVLGARVAESLFDADPVGQQIWIRGVTFDVIGVLAPRGALADGDLDNQVVIPVRTASRRLFNVTWLSMVYVSARGGDAGSTAAAGRAIEDVLRARHRAGTAGGQDFEVQDAARFFSMQRQVADTLTGFSSTLAAIALFVGGTGIMALMLLSVKERTSEIGLRMAVGAEPRDVLTQFLLESSALSLGGWLAGMLLGAVGATVVQLATEWQVGAPLQAILASFAMAVVIGLGFGAIPARRAAMIPPVRALGSR